MNPTASILFALIVFSRLSERLDGIVVAVHIDQGIAHVHVGHARTLQASPTDCVSGGGDRFPVLAEIQVDTGQTRVNLALAGFLCRLLEYRQCLIGTLGRLPCHTECLQMFGRSLDMAGLHPVLHDTGSPVRDTRRQIHIGQAEDLPFLTRFAGQVRHLSGHQLIDFLTEFAIHPTQLTPVAEARVVLDQLFQDLDYLGVIIFLVIQHSLEAPPAFLGQIALGFLLLDRLFQQSQGIVLAPDLVIRLGQQHFGVRTYDRGFLHPLL